MTRYGMIVPGFALGLIFTLGLYKVANSSAIIALAYHPSVSCQQLARVAWGAYGQSILKFNKRTHYYPTLKDEWMEWEALRPWFHDAWEAAATSIREDCKPTP